MAEERAVITGRDLDCWGKARHAAAAAAALAAWGLAYAMLVPFSEWVAHGLLGLGRGTAAGEAAAFFFYDAPKILLLLVIMVYAISWLRAGLRPESARKYLSGRARGAGYALAAGFGALSPFCSCSTIPLFIGFISARMPIGIAMAFLITSPIINEVAAVLLWGLLGWKVAAAYIAVGMLAGMAGGAIMDALRAGRWLQPLFRKEQLTVGLAGAAPGKITLAGRHAFAMGEAKGIFRKVWTWVILGVAAGAALHGYLPQDWLSARLGAGEWWATPAAVAAGIPLYTNATGIVPVMQGLMEKGLPLGTTLAFCMSAVAVSLPEFMMLRQVMTWRLLILFLGMLLAMFTIAGWVLNAAQGVIA